MPEQRHRVWLTEKQIESIRKMEKQGYSRRVTAERFGVDRTTIGAVIRGEGRYAAGAPEKCGPEK